jgi:hypothetical protein
LNSRLIRLTLRLARDTGASFDELLDAARALIAKNPKLKPDEVVDRLRATQ